jgi:hypothetical protein
MSHHKWHLHETYESVFQTVQNRFPFLEGFICDVIHRPSKSKCSQTVAGHWIAEGLRCVKIKYRERGHVITVRKKRPDIIRYVRFQVLTAASMKFRILLGCTAVHHTWWWRQYVPLKRRSTIILHGSTSQKTILNIIRYISKNLASGLYPVIDPSSF